MKRFFAFLCALILFFTEFPVITVSATENPGTDIVLQETLLQTERNLVEVEPENPALFPDLRPKKIMFKATRTALEHGLSDAFMDYLKQHFSNCETRFSIEQFNIPYSQWEELKPVIWYETPELFHIYSLGCSYYTDDDLIAEISVTYRPYANTAEKYQSCLDKMLDGAAYLLDGVKGNHALSDVEKALILHDRLAVWAEYDVAGANLDDPYSKIYGAYSALGEGSSVCQGYALAYMYLLEQAGIESDYCSSRELNHGWNIVYIDGVAYHVDVTWDDPTTSKATYNDVYGRVYHRNFLLSSNGIWNSGHDASDYNTTPNDVRYDGEGETTWWKDSYTAIQLLDNNLYYLDKDNGNVICADDGSTVYALADSSSSYKLSSAEGMLLCSTYYDLKAIDPKTGASSVVYTTQNGYIEGLKHEKGKLCVQLNDGNGNSHREIVDYIAPEIVDYTYTVTNGEATITGYTGTGGDVVIPDTLGGCPVTAIGEEVFWGCTSMTSVKIPDTVTTIGDYAFCYCTSLTSVTIPDGVKTIGEYAFAGYLDEETGDFASSLTSVTIGSGVTTIGADAFSACGKLTAVTIPDNVTRIDFGAFCFCYGLNSVTIGKGVTAIPDYAFRACDNLTTVTIPASVTTIGYAAFEHCTKLADVYYDGTESQWNSTSVDIYGNQYLQNATVHFAVQEEPENTDYVFTVENGKATITGYIGAGGDVIIPETLGGYPVTAIGYEAFYGCTSLTSVTIPSSVTYIDEAAFYECTSLISATIPDSVTKIGEWMFLSCNNLTTVNIPDSVTVIGEGAFYGCSNLASIAIPDSVTKIGVDAFAGCIRLTSVTIPNSITAIYEGTFYYCENLTSVEIPDSVSYIGENAFYYCYNLTDVYYDGTEEQWESVSVETGNEYLQNATIHFTKEPEEPEGTDYAYSVNNGEVTITGYTGAGGDIIIPATLDGYPVTLIGEDAFYGCASLTSVEIPNGVTKIGEWAFSNCTNLSSVTIPDSVTTIGAYAFGSCVSLTSVTIGNNVTEIGEWAFHFCTSLTSVTIPDSVTTIGEFAFADCDSLASAMIGEKVTTIGDYAFHDCYRLTSVTISDKLTTIGDAAFQYCTSLTVVTLPQSVTAIGAYAFSCCINLSAVTIGSSLTTVGECAFESCYSLKNVYYAETQSKWNEINICDGNSCLTSATIYYQHIHDYSLVPKLPVAATCTEDGYTEYTCVFGEKYRDDYVPALGHSMALVNAVPATCTEAGRTAGTACTRCDVLGTATLVSALGHTFTNYESDGNATCVSDGTETAKCDRCEETHTRTEVDSAKGHSYETVITAPTCTEQGYTTFTCACGDTYVGDYTDVLDHDYEAVVYEPTCLDIGFTVYICRRCDYAYNDDWVDALCHSFTNYASDNNATCVSDGTETAKCDRCEETHTRVEEGTVKGHDCEAVVYEPTCLDIGFTHYECRRCDYAYDDNWVEALGHSYTNACDRTCDRVGCAATRTTTHNYAAATCTKAKTCKVCKATSGKALGHTYKSGSCTRCKNKPAGAKITTQPVNVAVASGKTAKVTIKATGTGLKYTWYYAKKGAKTYTKATSTTNSYSLKMSSSYDGTKVYCVVSDAYGNSVKSSVVTIYKGTPAKITTQPKSVTVANGKTGKLEIKASGSSLKYQWYIKYKGASSFTKVGASSKTYSFKMASKLNGAQAYCVVKDKYGIEVKSSVVTIKMPAQPKVTTQPKSVTQVSGKTVKFTVKASGEGLKYQWYYAKKGSSSFKKLSGATKTTYSVKVSSSVNGRKYYCLVTDKYGQTVKSSTVTLTMKTVAKITTQPKSVTVANGKTAKVTIKAVGDGLKYTWYYLKPGATKYVKASATGASYSVKMAAAWKNAKVYCVISDKYGNTVKSSVVTLKMK